MTRETSIDLMAGYNLEHHLGIPEDNLLRTSRLGRYPF